VKHIPVDISRLKFLVVGVPTAQMREGKAVLDRETGRPVWNLPLAVMGEGRAETIELAVPEGGFPSDLAIAVFVVPDGMVSFHWEKSGRSGVMDRAKSLKVVGGSAALKATAA
jgi:hypothetical protein